MNRIITLLALAAISLSSWSQTKVIAHRGHWQTASSAQNSLTAIDMAKQAGCYATEFDVWMTADGVCVVYHDADINGIRIENTRYSDIRDFRLGNGETLPTLEQYLWHGAHALPMRLILEIKPHSKPESERRCVDEVLRLVKKYGVVDMTDYISFSLPICQYIVERAPQILNGPNGQRSGKRQDKVETHVEYLGGDLTPQQVKDKGLQGIDYHQDILLDKHPEWIEQSHRLGLTVNVWTVDDLNKMWTLISRNVDRITTNRPVEAIKLTR